MINRLRQIFKNRLRVLIFIVLVVGAGFIGWRTFGKRQQKPQYQTAKVERGTIVSSVSVSGQIISANLVNVTTQTSGVVKKVFVKDGDIVTAGQKLMEITLDSSGQQKNASAWSSYLSAKNTLDSANANAYSLRSTKDTAWKKFYDLATSSTYQNPDGTPKEDQRNSSVEFQSAQAEWLAAEAKYKNQENVFAQARVALNNAWLSYQLSSPIVTAPIAGTISSITVAEGMRLGGNETSQSQKVAVIQSQANPLATFNLSEIDVSQVSTGQKATITLDSLPEKTFTGKVVSLDKVGAVTSGVTNYPVIIQFDTSSEQILPNMTATAEIIIEAKENALWVPPQAIRTQAGQTGVRVLVNGKPQEKQVEVGLETSSQAEIVSGLSEGETVVVSEITAGEQTTFGGGGMRGIMPGGFGGGGR